MSSNLVDVDLLISNDCIWENGGLRLSTSSYGEDRVLAHLFRNYSNGFYVDFGCYDPIYASNTYLLHKRGWRGLNIDANPVSVEKFESQRPNDINKNIAISASEEIVELLIFGDMASSNTTSKAFSLEISARQDVEILKTLSLSAMRTEEIFDLYLPPQTKIDFWNIDIESLDYEALISNNWDRYRPSIIAIEDFEFRSDKISRIEEFLITNNYIFNSKCIHTTIYIEAGFRQ
jgi:hypothetical protein